MSEEHEELSTYTPLHWVSMTEDQRFEDWLRLKRRVNELADPSASPREPAPQPPDYRAAWEEIHKVYDQAVELLNAAPKSYLGWNWVHALVDALLAARRTQSERAQETGLLQAAVDLERQHSARLHAECRSLEAERDKQEEAWAELTETSVRLLSRAEAAEAALDADRLRLRGALKEAIERFKVFETRGDLADDDQARAGRDWRRWQSIMNLGAALSASSPAAGPAPKLKE